MACETLTHLAALAEAWLAQRPRGEVVTATGLLLDVRDAIHVVTGRGRDRLLRQDHDAVAALLGRRRRRPAHRDLRRRVGLLIRSMQRCVARSQAQRARCPRVGPRRPQMTPLGLDSPATVNSVPGTIGCSPTRFCSSERPPGGRPWSTDRSRDP